MSNQICTELVHGATCGTHLPLSVFHHLITHVRLSVPLFTCRLRQRQEEEGGGGQLWGRFFKAFRNSCKPCLALHLFKFCSG